MKTAVIIPCYQVKSHILGVLGSIPSYVERIYVVDDTCPEQTGEYVISQCSDPRVTVLKNQTNKGVGGATMVGMDQALTDGMDVFVKLDGDGQMDPKLIHGFISPIIHRQTDFTKGNRFFFADSFKRMPRARLISNIVYSFFSKFSTGYWSVSDPVNGYIAIHRSIYQLLNREDIHQRYFFESDLLHQLGLARARVTEIPMLAIYGQEISQLRIRHNLHVFIKRSVHNAIRRVWLRYFLMEFSVASLLLLIGLPLAIFGFALGLYWWVFGVVQGETASPGMVMLPSLSILLGLQMIFSFLTYDMQSEPSQPLQISLEN